MIYANTQTEKALYAVREERTRQDKTWGVQRPDWPVWMLILGEEVGEAQKAALTMEFPPHDTTLGPRELLDQFRTELLHVAAVAVAVIEHIDELTR